MPVNRETPVRAHQPPWADEHGLKVPTSDEPAKCVSAFVNGKQQQDQRNHGSEERHDWKEARRALDRLNG